jgi:hypothetical protein
MVKKKVKALSIMGSGDAWGSDMSRLPHFLDSRLTDGSEVSHMHWLPLPP